MSKGIRRKAITRMAIHISAPARLLCGRAKGRVFLQSKKAKQTKRCSEKAKPMGTILSFHDKTERVFDQTQKQLLTAILAKKRLFVFDGFQVFLFLVAKKRTSKNEILKTKSKNKKEKSCFVNFFFF
jgi:hypothetical protein